MSIGYQVREDVFEHIAKNAGILLSEFDTESWTVTRSNIIGATSGGINFTDTATYSDMGDDIDNMPKNMMELKNLDTHEVKVSGSFVAISPEEIAKLIGAADYSASESKITPRNEIKTSDFRTLWFVTDYGDGGAIAVRLDNVLSTTGYALQTADKGKGTTAFEYTAHYSMSNPDSVPYEIFIKEGAAA